MFNWLSGALRTAIRAAPAVTDQPGAHAYTESHEQHLAVLGSPIAHSLSPRIHAAAYRALSLPWRYEAIECETDELAHLLQGTDETWRGFSVTMPLKERAYEIAMLHDSAAQHSQVVNTLFRLAGSAGWAGFNTDVAGLALALEEAHLDVTHTVVLGAGATAVSAILAAQSLEAQRITVCARRPEAAQSIAKRFACEWATLSPEQPQIADPTLVISTLPNSAGETVVLPAGLIETPLFDVAYAPWPTALAARFQSAGTATHSGIAMLLNQALLQVRIFVNGDASLPLEQEDQVKQAMREAVL